MPYLSRLVLDPACDRVVADLASAYSMHRTVMRAFPGPREGSRVLYRLDSLPATGAAGLLVQSREPADWTFLESIPGYLLPAAPGASPNPAQVAFALDLRDGEILAFRLRANPTFRRGRRRLGHQRRCDQLRWLARQGARWGFEPLAVAVAQEGRLLTRKGAAGCSRHLCFVSVLFTGLLRVVCPEALQAAVEAGIGTGKAFGFGLLSLAPPQ